ncbi:CoA transferase [Pseudonocardia lutea]|uniref:CoA transferase n=1 Tax=Pseudonocardia lutea TaxID=2172015 RepID=A0ABW1IHE3_9PSEU
MTSPTPATRLRVVEASTGTGAAVLGRVLAALGHDVLRCAAPAPSGSAHDWLRAGKTEVATTEDTYGSEAFAELLDGADLLITDAPEAQLHERGWSPEALRRLWPDLVVVSLTCFGLDNPEANVWGDSLLAEAAGGLAWMIGEPDRRPLSLGGEQTAYAAAFAALYGASLALLRRSRGAGGDLVDVAMCDVAAYMDWKTDMSFRGAGVVARRTGRTGGRWRMLPCRDGWIGVVFQDTEWDLLVEVVDDPRLADPALRSPAARAARAGEWWAVVAQWAAERGKEETYTRAQLAGLPFGYAADVADLAASTQLRSRGFVREAGADGWPVGPLFHGLPWTDGPVPSPGTARGWRDRPGPLPVRPAAEAPLSGTRVLDFGTITAGAATGRLLADYGAEVIKVESYERPDPFRGWLLPGQPVPAAGLPPESPAFDANNAGKQSIALDLKDPEARARLLELAATCDVIVENFRVGVTERLGITYDDIRAVNPDVIYLSMSSQGQAGPESRFKSFGSTLDLTSGLASITGYDAETPTWSSSDVNYPDQIVSLLGAGVVGYCLAVRERGRHIDLAQREVVAWTLAGLLCEHATTGTVPRPSGNQRPGAFPHDTYRCAGRGSGWFAVACRTGAERAALAGLVGLDWDPDDPARWAQREEELRAALEAWARERSPLEASDALRSAGVPAAPVHDSRTRAASPRFADRRVYLDDGGRHLKGFPFVLRRYRPPVPPEPSELGADNAVFGFEQRAPAPVR